MVDDDNKYGCDKFFWYAPIDNVDETKGLSEMTSWKTKSRYVAKPLKRVNLSYEKGSTIGTKNVPSDTSSVRTETPTRKPKPRASIHKSSEQFVAQKCQRNAGYKKNLKESK